MALSEPENWKIHLLQPGLRRKSYISLALPYEVNDPQELAGRGTGPNDWRNSEMLTLRILRFWYSQILLDQIVRFVQTRLILPQLSFPTLWDR